MVYSRFSAGILLQIIIISVTGSLLLWSAGQPWLLVSKYSFSLAFLLEIIYLYYYLHRTQRSLQIFLDSTKYLDKVNNSLYAGISISRFNLSNNEILDLIRKSRLDRELEHQYFRNTIEHLNIGILSYDQDGKIEIINQAAKDMIQIRELKNIHLIEKIIPGIYKEIVALKPGQNRLISSNINEESLLLSLRCSDFLLANRPIRIISIQNIKREIEEEEIIAWQKLIRVLTHEIMNSVSPVKSLTHTLISLLERDSRPVSLQEMTDESLVKCLSGLKAIENRSKGLMSFVDNYRTLTRLPDPVMKEIATTSWLKNLILLMREEEGSIEIPIFLNVQPANLQLWGDEKLLSQVMINLIRNAREAIQDKENGRIEIRSEKSDSGSVKIEVIDNGRGISREEIDSIFIPFFSTKEGGSGIGLSISRQIMQLHGGTIRAHSGKELTRFVLEFR